MAISISPIYNFDQMSLEEATRILYDNIVPKCEENDIRLACCGNYPKTHMLFQLYDQEKQECTLFNVEKVKKVYKCLDEVMSNLGEESISSYSLTKLLTNHLNENILAGDCTAAMLMKGYIADFRSADAVDKWKLQLQCEFKKLHSVDYIYNKSMEGMIFPPM